MNLLLLGIAVVLNASAQMLLKTGMAKISLIGGFPAIMKDPIIMIKSGWLWAGLSAYGVSFFVYILVLMKMEVSRASTVMMASTVLLVFVISIVLLNESISGTKAIGVCFAIVGCTLVLVAR